MPWISLDIDGALNIYLIDQIGDLDVKDSSITLWLSDFRVVYKEHLSVSQMLARAKEENPQVECDSKTILSTTLRCEGARQLQLLPTENTDTFHLKCKYYISELPFHFYWNLTQQTPDEFFDVITKPLMAGLIEKEFQCTQLFDVIERKDAEIEQYKQDGAELIRKHLATAPFDRRKFEQTNNPEVIGSFALLTKDTLPDSSALKNLFGIRRLNVDTGQPPFESTQLSVTKRPSASPLKPAKKITKEMLARSKFQAGPEVSMVYSDDDSSNEEALNPSTRTVPKVHSKKNKPKIKTKLNL